MFGWLFRSSPPVPPPPTSRVSSPGIPVRNRVRNRRKLTPEQIRRMQRISAQNRQQVEVNRDDFEDLLSLLMLHEMLATDSSVEIGFCSSYFDMQTSGEWDRIANGEVLPEELEVQADPNTENPDAPGAESEPADTEIETEVAEVQPETVEHVDIRRDDVMSSYSPDPAPIVEDDTTRNSSWGGGSNYGGGGYDSGGSDFGGGSDSGSSFD